jgi:hypothetical protein
LIEPFIKIKIFLPASSSSGESFFSCGSAVAEEVIPRRPKTSGVELGGEAIPKKGRKGGKKNKSAAKLRS